MADPGTPDWWLDRLYKKLRDRAPQIRTWNDWYTGAHPVPEGYEGADALFQRIMDTVGLNMMSVVTDAPMPRMRIKGFKVNGVTNDALWTIWQGNNFDRGSKLVRQEKMALSESYVMVDPNGGNPILTPEHPEQVIVEYAPGSTRSRVAGLKVWLDEVDSAGPQVKAFLDLGTQVYTYSAPTRIYTDPERRSMLAMRPGWEFQPEKSGPNSLGEVAMVPFPNRARMLDAPAPEFEQAIIPQKRINKTLLDRMAMQDQGAFKAMWATGLKIPRDPVTKEPVEKFLKAVNRTFVNENPDGKYGQLQAEDVKQMLEAANDDIADCAMLVPTSADHILAKLINVSGDGLKLAQVSEVGRARDRMAEEDDSWEDVGRLSLKAAGEKVPNVGRMTTEWANPEYRTDTEAANAAQIGISAGMPLEVAWERYFDASPDDVKDWAAKRNQQLTDPAIADFLKGLPGANPDPGAGA